MIFWVAFVIVFVIVFLPVVCLLIRWKLSYRVLSSYGINGPSPVLYYGNGKQIGTLGILKFVEMNLKKYGDVFGYYIGIQPVIAVKDLEMLKQIMVKQFDSFIDRQIIIDVLREKSESKVRGLLNSRGEDWRRMRRILSKSFNATNLSKMSSLIETSCESLVMKLSDFADKKESFDIWELYGLYTMEVILATAFGHRADVINGEADELAEASASIFAYARGSSGNSVVTTILSNFPFLEGYVRSQALKSKAAKNYLYVEALCEKLVKNRLEEGEHCGNYQDLLQLQIDARADPDDDDDDETGYQINDSNKRKLSHVEIVRNSVAFLLAGHETTNNLLGYASYLLALHPEEQDKLYKEITDFYSNKPSASLYEATQSLAYIDMVIQESLRMFPPAPLTNRNASKKIEINGQIFPKDSTVTVPVMAIHHSPDIWPEPSSFRPERFTKEEKEKRHQLAHMPFGWGPRSCIGMRLALIEAKMALIAIIKEYKFVEAPDTEKPLKTIVGITMIPTNGIYLLLQKR